jgi:hypothetical protein
MTNSRKKGELSKTTQSYLQLWLKEQIYGRKKELSSKYIDKGNLMEDNAIDFLGECYDEFMLKNKKHFESEYFTGTPDIIQKDTIFDIKCSWDFTSFPLFENQIPNKDYYYQAQVYMDLVGIDNYKLVYCLMDTPKHLIESEARSHCFRTGHDFDDVIDEFTKKMTFSDIDEDLRIKIFDIKKDPEVIDQMKQRVIECREYINQLNY